MTIMKEYLKPEMKAIELENICQVLQGSLESGFIEDEGGEDDFS